MEKVDKDLHFKRYIFTFEFYIFKEQINLHYINYSRTWIKDGKFMEIL